MRAGRFITLEGVEGVGKSTQLAFISDYLQGSGRQVLVTREPGGTTLGEKLRELLLNEHTQTLSADAETLLMFAARAQHLDTVIRPALARGVWVVCDRFTDATHAYQGAGRGVNETLLTCLVTSVQRGLEPDLTLLLDAPAETGLARIGDRALDRFEKEGIDFLNRVRDGYLKLAARHPQRIRIIDARPTAQQVQREIVACLDALLDSAAPVTP